METYYTIEEKYLQVLDELSYGERPRALKLLNEIITNEPGYARAHFQLGMLYYYSIEDYQAAGYHFKRFAELEPEFPELYEHYLRLVVFLGMNKMVAVIAGKALSVKGVNIAVIYGLLGLFAEKKKQWQEATDHYRKALLESTDQDEQKTMEEDIKRVNAKRLTERKYIYLVS
jgi:tetratricopeptide (TPR) repeat protein